MLVTISTSSGSEFQYNCSLSTCDWQTTEWIKLSCFSFNLWKFNLSWSSSWGGRWPIYCTDMVWIYFAFYWESEPQFLLFGQLPMVKCMNFSLAFPSFVAKSSQYSSLKSICFWRPLIKWRWRYEWAVIFMLPLLFFYFWSLHFQYFFHYFLALTFNMFNSWCIVTLKCRSLKIIVCFVAVFLLEGPGRRVEPCWTF